MTSFANLVQQTEFSHADLVRMLASTGPDRTELFRASEAIKARTVGKVVYFRGLIEFSNICTKDCYYCGIRKSNSKPERYAIDDQRVLDAARFAYENRYASIVLQAGERSDARFVNTIEHLLHQITELSQGQLGITLSLGEQSPETYARWKAAGAHRYLLRIESSDRQLYNSIHPNDAAHSFDQRLQALQQLRAAGYQVGTGVMIGLPFQTLEHLANDLLFFKEWDFDMIGMGPYIEHADTPLYQHADTLWPLSQRFDMGLKMVATLRLLMPDINIAAATALQAIDPAGREKAVKVGANIIMPNITPTAQRGQYLLYPNKPCTDEGAEDCSNCLEARIHMAGNEIGYGQWGDSLHFAKRQS